MARKSTWILAGAALLLLAVGIDAAERDDTMTTQTTEKAIDLPEPDRAGSVSLEETLANRRSVRSYADAPVSPAEISQILWAAQGITHPAGYRTAPSAGALYPLEVYLALGKGEGIAPGVYHYDPHGHRLKKISEGDPRAELSRAALGQGAVRDAPMVVVLCAVYERVTGKYGDRGIRYTHMEAGHAGQNILLEAVARGLAAVPIGAFDDRKVASVIGVSGQERPLYLIPVGHPGK